VTDDSIDGIDGIDGMDNATDDIAPATEEEWVPPLWPRYVGVVVLSLVLVGCVALTVHGFRAMTSGGESNDVFTIVLGGAGLWYVSSELKAALARLRDARAAAAGSGGGPAAP
jgi:hypothetical protein